MRSVKTDFVFYMVLSTALLLLFYLLYNSLHRIENARHLIKTASTLAFPVPMALLFVFFTAGKDLFSREVTQKDIVFSILIFAGLMLLVLFCLYEYNMLHPHKRFQDRKNTPVLITSFLTFGYVMNYFKAKNIYVSGILSGLLMGLALFIFLN